MIPLSLSLTKFSSKQGLCGCAGFLLKYLEWRCLANSGQRAVIILKREKSRKFNESRQQQPTGEREAIISQD